MRRDVALRIANDLPGMMWPRELGWLFDTMAESRRHAEIGVYCGKSLFATCAGFNNPCQVLAIDNLSQTQISPGWTKAVLFATIRLIQNRTKAKIDVDTRSSFESWRDQKTKFDSVFIDGNHDYAECKRDILCWSQIIRPGGIIAGHDYWPLHDGVMNAVNETGDFSVIPDTRIWFRRQGH